MSSHFKWTDRPIRAASQGKAECFQSSPRLCVCRRSTARMSRSEPSSRPCSTMTCLPIHCAPTSWCASFIAITRPRAWPCAISPPHRIGGRRATDIGSCVVANTWWICGLSGSASRRPSWRTRGDGHAPCKECPACDLSASPAHFPCTAPHQKTILIC